jgi:hypothetical protein
MLFKKKETAMSVSVTASTGQSALFKVGWIVLVLSAGLMTLNHLVLIFFLDTPILFLGWAAFNLYSLVVIGIPFRRLEKWAWYATWILPVGLAAGGFTAPDIALFYYAVAAACVVGLLVTMRDFFAGDRARR